MRENAAFNVFFPLKDEATVRAWLPEFENENAYALGRVDTVGVIELNETMFLVSFISEGDAQAMRRHFYPDL